MLFVNDCITGARSQASFFLTDIGVRFSRERYLGFVFGVELLDRFRKVMETFNRRFLVTLDGFDTAFDSFRLVGVRAGNADVLRRRTHFEIDWLRSLLSLAIQAKRSQDYLYNMLDFCIAAPKDRFMEVRRIERDSYRHWHRWCSLTWSGIELGILLRKRLEVLAEYQTDRNSSPRQRLEEILRHKIFTNIPIDISFEYNGKNYSMPLFMYVLRHTFWRPREVLLYYAGILALAEDMKRWRYDITTDALRKCVKATTTTIIESEFLNEFQSTIVNIREIVLAFRKQKIILQYDSLRQILSTLNFRFTSGSLEEITLTEKIEFLYEIGFLGVRANKELMERFGLKLEDAFCFNEGNSMFLAAHEDDFVKWTFVVHPIFSEYLRLDTQGQDLILRFTWDYLHLGDALLSANPCA
jgi:hypothetical protein